MKKILFLGLISMCSFSFGQNFNSDAELNRMAATPNSPEAQAFGSYGSNDINMRIGASNISVPLYTYKGLEMDLPISITYDMNARKVEDIATGMGLGWNLNLGGSVSRIANGLPDEMDNYFSGAAEFASLLQDTGFQGLRTQYSLYKDKVYNNNTNGINGFNSEAELDSFFDYVARLQTGAYDVLLDSYQVQAPGLSEYVIAEFFDDNGISVTARAITNPTVDISEWKGIRWVVTSGNGTKYTFQEKEITTSNTGLDDTVAGQQAPKGPFDYTFTSAWFLTKIVSANGKDTYTFEYTPLSNWSNPVKTWISKLTDVAPLNGGAWTQENSTGSPDYKIDQKALTKVYHNGVLIIDITLGSRDDHQNASKIESIDINSTIGNNSRVKRIEFDHSYFGDPASVNTENDWRLKLDAIKIAGSGYSGSGYNFEKVFSFDYQSPTQMPPRDSPDQDMFGFFNGAPNNSNLIPQWTFTNGQNLPGANRDFSESHAKIGILTSMTNPLGGVTQYNYEPHTNSNYSASELFGLRVSSISNYENSNTSQTPISKVIYEYPDANSIVDPSMLPLLGYYTTEPENTSSGQMRTKYHRLGKNDMGDQPYISYTKVIKKVVNPATNNADYGKTVYEFFGATVDQDPMGSYVDSNIPPYTKSYASNIEKGNLQKQTVYDTGNNVLSVSTSAYNPSLVANSQVRYFVEDNPANRFYFIQKVNAGGGIYNAAYIEGTDSGGIPQPPPSCTNCINNPTLGRIAPKVAFIHEEYLLSSSGSSTQTLEGNTITTTSSSTYDPNVSYLMKESESSTSETGEVYITKNYYPQELAGQSPEIDDLIAANRLVSPLKVESYREVNGTNPELISTQQTQYDNFSASGNTYLMPEVIYAARAGDTPESRIVFEQYDKYGNLVQVRKTAGSSTSYIWGFEGRLPVAKIENLSYDNAIATTGVNMTTIENPNTSSATINSMTDLIRQAHPNAMVTSYSYNQNMDVETITDPRGYTSTFHYDDQDRLQYVTDSDDKVLSSNEYNYKQ